ncbi:hypothetical protein [Foetidibacter luteolus]|uniref:hypothetical protein n=1 Tax=Foetidibacter luteolus TaxID=2608880 RepID=UPI00129B328F|nr:hypothetical protein [Foetidibacter luteolus]
MTKVFSTLLVLFYSSFCYCQITNTSKVKRRTFDTYEELRKKQEKYSVEKLTYLDSTFNFQVEIPNWLNLKETGTVYAFGGTLPAVDGIENAILIKVFDKPKFPTFSDFKKFVIEDLAFGQSPKWSVSHKFMGKKELGRYNNIGDSYKVYLMRGNLMYHCEYILLETKSAYLWIDYTSTQETFDKNFAKFEEFMSGFKVTDF